MPTSSAPPSLAYVVARYPAPSHAFILREVWELRALGARLCTFAMRRASDAELLTDADRAEAARTDAVLPTRATRLLGAHAEALRASPRHYLGTLASALRLGDPGVRGRLWQLFYFAEAILVWRRCRELGVRHLHAHFGNVAADVAGLAADFGGRTDGGRWSWSFTSHGSVELSEMSRERLAAKVRRAALVVCVSDFGRSQLLPLLPDADWGKLHVVHCGIDPEEYVPVPRDGRAGRPLRILTVGRLHPLKGQRILLRALARLVGEGRDVRLTLVGEGPERGPLEREARRLGIAERVDFRGAVGQDRIRSVYADADIFCLPSLEEGLPVVLMEAMAMELPVVATGITGVPELVEDGVGGLLVRPGRCEPLAAALGRLGDDPELGLRMGAAGRGKVLREFDARRSAAELYELFAGVGA